MQNETFKYFNAYIFITKMEKNTMPNRNKTGPKGEGPKTGRQMGDCEGAEPTGEEFGPGAGLGRGLARGAGRGAGRGRRAKQD